VQKKTIEAHAAEISEQNEWRELEESAAEFERKDAVKVKLEPAAESEPQSKKSRCGEKN
jgi:hypothetical protein